MEKKIIDMATYPRRSHFERFKEYADPYAGVTVNVDITGAYRRIKEDGLPVFISLLYAMVMGANRVPQFRQRFEGDGIAEYDFCHASYTVSKPDGTYRHCHTNCRGSLEEFIRSTAAAQERALQADGIDEAEDVVSRLFVSSTPWYSFTHCVQPTPAEKDSNPRIVFGKFYEENGKILMPVNILVNHAIVDGYHIALFLDAFSDELKKIAERS